MRTPALLLIRILAFAVPQLGAQASSPAAITVISGSTAEGKATEQWLAILRRRLSPSAYDSVAALARPTLPEEQAWAGAITARSAGWHAEMPRLTALFPGITAGPLRIVLGNRGAEDAFSHDSLTIGFDLAALVRVYGPASAAGAADRLDRLFRHEATHTLQKRWLARHPFVTRTPLDQALLDIWLEGLGNYFSLSSRWKATSERLPSAPATHARAVLEPRFVDRMGRLVCADSVTAIPLLAGLSAGPFEEKWGALPTALWLQEEADADSLALRRFVRGGPEGVWSIAHRHLPPALADALSRARNRPCSPA